jgi:demethylmenaquinone methyltransferase/2-methoxy-6-polyprenyl-1,4-benzoquinol methylase
MSPARPSPTAASSTTVGARPEGVESEREAARHVREMFSGIAPRYDLLNHVLSMSLDRVWRRRVAQRFHDVLERRDARSLDLCCGTGDLTLSLLRRSRGEVFGSDFAHPMLVRAAKKSNAERSRSQQGGRLVGYIEADALTLPFADASFDLVTLAFGFRNLSNYDGGLREIARVLRPGGQIGILEFAEPRGEFFGALYRFYFTKMLPRIGGAISGDASAYSYLPDSVLKFPSPDELARRMGAAGFAEARYELWTGGVVALHRGTKQNGTSD